MRWLRWLRWLGDRHWIGLDALCAGALAAAGSAAVLASGAGAALLLLAVAQAVPVAWRRRAPLWTLAVSVPAGLALAGLGVSGLPAGLAPMLEVYSLAVTTSWARSVPGLGFAVLGTDAALFAGGDRASYLAINTLALLAAAAFGANTRVRRAYLAELASRAAAAERARIARELHDIVTHNVTVMVIAAGASRMAEPRAERLRAELATVEELGRQTLAELRRLLGVLRAGDHVDPGAAPGAVVPAPREPQPGLARLDPLLARARAAGLTVDLTVRGEPRPLPQGVDVSAFRIVQEALSNTLRHGGRCRASVEVTYGAEELELSIVDSGNGVPRDATANGGHGIAGMRERAALFGGRLDAGPVSGGGFAVRAALPLGGGG